VHKHLIGTCLVALLTLPVTAACGEVSAPTDSMPVNYGGFWATVQFALPGTPDPFDDNYSTGLGGVIGFDHRLAKGLRFLIQVSYTGFPGRGSDYRGHTIGLATAGTGLKWTPGRSGRLFRPYIFGDIGVAVVWQPLDDTSELDEHGNSATLWDLRGRESFYYHLGVGIERRLSGKFCVFAQVSSINVVTIKDNWPDANQMRVTNLSLGFQIATR